MLLPALCDWCARGANRELRRASRATINLALDAGRQDHQETKRNSDRLFVECISMDFKALCLTTRPQKNDRRCLAARGTGCPP